MTSSPRRCSRQWSSRRKSATCRNAWWPSTSSGRAKRRTRSRSAPGRASPSGWRSRSRSTSRSRCRGPKPSARFRTGPSGRRRRGTARLRSFRRQSHRSPRLSTSRSRSRGCRRHTMSRRAINRGWRFCQSSCWVLLGIALGYPAGYIRGNREPPTVTATAPPPAERHEATSGSATTSVTVPPPPTVPAKPSEATPSVPAAAPAGGAKVEAPAPPPSRAPKPVATTGRIVITSSPAKAAVTINGTWSGRTPLTVDDLKFGKYVVRVVQPGFEVARKEVALSSSAPSGTFDTTLRPAKAPARAPAPEAKAAQAPPPASPSKPAGGDDRRDLRRFASAWRPRLHRWQGSRGHAGAADRPATRSASRAARTGGPPVVDRDENRRRRGTGARHGFARAHQVNYGRR